MLSRQVCRRGQASSSGQGCEGTGGAHGSTARQPPQRCRVQHGTRSKASISRGHQPNAWRRIMVCCHLIGTALAGAAQLPSEQRCDPPAWSARRVQRARLRCLCQPHGSAAHLFGAHLRPGRSARRRRPRHGAFEPASVRAALQAYVPRLMRRLLELFRAQSVLRSASGPDHAAFSC